MKTFYNSKKAWSFADQISSLGFDYVIESRGNGVFTVLFWEI